MPHLNLEDFPIFSADMFGLDTKDSKEEPDQKNAQSATDGETAEIQASKEPTTAVDFSDGKRQLPDSEYRGEEREKGTGEDENKRASRDLNIDSNEEEKPDSLKETIDAINEAMVEAYNWRRKNAAENVVRALARPDNTADINELINGSSTDDCLQICYKEVMKQVAALIVQQVYARVGCYENFVRRADWADEPSTAEGDVMANPAAYSFKANEKVYIYILPKGKMEGGGGGVERKTLRELKQRQTRRRGQRLKKQ